MQVAIAHDATLKFCSLLFVVIFYRVDGQQITRDLHPIGSNNRIHFGGLPINVHVSEYELVCVTLLMHIVE